MDHSLIQSNEGKLLTTVASEVVASGNQSRAKLSNDLSLFQRFFFNQSCWLFAASDC